MFFIFGPTPDSWVIGNKVFTTQYGMPSNVQTWIENETVSGEKLQWASAGPGGLMCFSNWPASDRWRTDRDQGEIYFQQDENLEADVHNGGVEHVTFSSGGGWFAFHDKAMEYMMTKGPNASIPQTSSISNVFFGTDDAIIIQQNVPSVPSYLRNNGLIWTGMPDDVSESLRDMHTKGWVLTRNTCLSPHNKEHYYIEWTGQYGSEIRSMYSLPDHPMLPPLFARQIWEGEVPTSIPKEMPKEHFRAPLKRIKSMPPEVTDPTSNMTKFGSSNPIEEVFNMCEDLFEQWSDSPNAMSGQRFKALCKSILPVSDMAKIWTMADADGNGEFSIDEFTIAFCLVLTKKGGIALPATTTQLELAIMNRSKTGPHRARFTKLFEQSTKLLCTTCKEDIRTGSWMCTGCAGCVEMGVRPPNVAFALCVSCAFEHAEKLKFQKHNEVWARHVLYSPNNIQGGYLCSLCGIHWQGQKRPHVCLKCDFDACESCYETDLLCPEGHELKTVNDDLTSDLSSLSLNGMGSSNPFLTNDEDEDGTNPFSSSYQSKKKTSNPKDEPLTDEQKALRGSLQSSILRESPNVKWEDVAGLDTAKEELQEAVILPIKFPKLFSGKRKARTGILLYGPPGTGKSYLAKAVATEASATLFSISSSDVMSKWLGESERLIKTLFDLARESRPSVVFIDEIDALCGSRDALHANPHMAGLKTEIMVQMDGVGHDNEGVLVLAATNLPWSLDPAIRRRLQRKIYIPLPDEPARSRMFEIHVGKTPCGLKPEHYTELGKRTDGLSGSDIGNAVQDALMQPVKKVSSSKHWRKVTHNGAEKLSPCNATDPGAVPMSWRQVPASKLLESAVEVGDFFEVLQKVKPTVSHDEIKKYLDWTEQFGMEG